MKSFMMIFHLKKLIELICDEIGKHDLFRYIWLDEWNNDNMIDNKL